MSNSVVRMATRAKAAAHQMALVPTKEKNTALRAMARALKEKKDYLIRENAKDLKAAEKERYSSALVDRLVLNPKRVDGMARCLVEAARIKDPVGEVLRVFKRPNGLIIKKVRVPIGVVGIIYESRPNVTSDCVGLCLKAGNAVILKGGKEAFYSNQAIFSVLKEVLKQTAIPVDAIQLISSRDRDAVKVLLQQDALVDLIVPRGGEGLIRFVAQNSLIPVVKHYKGVCHTYVSARADLAMAEEICFNAKTQRPGVCNAMETMLVHQEVAAAFLPSMVRRLQQAGVEVRGCPRTRRVAQGVRPARQDDWTEEYLDKILSVKVVNSTEEAIAHINRYGSRHSDAIVTKDKTEAESFLKGVDSATVYVNASTRFTDGYEFGFGAEVGISTDKLHARGPMALEELNTYKYLIYGRGQIRS